MTGKAYQAQRVKLTIKKAALGKRGVLEIQSTSGSARLRARVRVIPRSMARVATAG